MRKFSLSLVLALFGVLGMQAQALDGYYYIKNNASNNYVQVKGRIHAAPDATDPTTLPGCVIKVATEDNGKVTELRSQAVDVPNAIGRAMKYIPEIVELVVAKLAVEGSGDDYLLGTTGVDAIMQKFNENIDPSFYIEETDMGYRIYAKTPSMTPVKEFYLENKAKVDSKLMEPGLEETINKILLKVINKVKGSNMTTIPAKWEFNVHTIWQEMGGTLIEPVDDASKLAFYQEVLTNEANIWLFAQTTAIHYLNAVETSQTFATYSTDPRFADYMKYWGLAKKVVNQIRPDFKYYVVADGNDFTFISEGNKDIKNNEARTFWTLEEVGNTFVLNLNSALTQDEMYYGTMYTDFGYTLPANCTAYAISEITTDGYAITAEIGNKVPAQTPVLIEGNTTALQLTPTDGIRAYSGTNLLVGNDFLIKEYGIVNDMISTAYGLASGYVNALREYKYLTLKTAGTVNNKFFFTLSASELEDAMGTEFTLEGKVQVFNIGYAGSNAGLLGFFKYKGTLPGNKAFLYAPEYEYAAKGASILSFDGEATGIKEVNNEAIANETVFDLQGRKVNNPFNGIVIVNGKKVMFNK
ncbi:MAG: hypothetical protein IJK87_11020 [Prevotella sp.]|nr:hypothetical protein [Prevotella sp.]